MAVPIFVAVYFGVFLEAAGLKLSSVPQIYPQKSHVVVDAHTDLVLGCRGAEPLRWTFHDDVNGRHYNTSQKNISYSNNTTELEYKFETILTIYNVSHVNVGFYYCHGEKPLFDTPRRSNRIYVFAQDDNDLSVITSETYSVISYLSFWTIPCRPTSPDINITLKSDTDFSVSVTPSNYSEVKNIEGYRVSFDPYDGFTVRSDYTGFIGVICRCFFGRKDNSFSFNTEFSLYEDTIGFEPHIEGLDTVNLGENITLQCSVLCDLYFPYIEYGLRWNGALSGNYAVENHYTLKLKHYNVLISTLTIKNVSIEDQGFYWCKLRFLKANKYVAVHDKEVSRPRIYSPAPGQKEIQVNSGDNITLRCEGSRSVTWSWDENEDEDEKYNTRHITYLEKNGLYYSFLQMTSVHYNNTKFYYCHEQDSEKKHPLKSNYIYIFVKDKQNLHVPQSKWIDRVYLYTNMTVPCRPTSRDVNVTLSMKYKNYNWSTGRFDEPSPINLTIYAYDPRKGFTVQAPVHYGHITATCTFITDTVKSTLIFTNYAVYLICKTTHYACRSGRSEAYVNCSHKNLKYEMLNLQTCYRFNKIQHYQKITMLVLVILIALAHFTNYITGTAAQHQTYDYAQDSLPETVKLKNCEFL